MTTLLLITNTIGKTYICSLKINKHALPIIITKSREVRFSILFWHMFQRKFVDATHVLLCESNQ